MRIGSNLSGADLSALANLNQVFQQLTAISAQLSTGRRINRGSDDPAGLLAVESLRSELASMEQASRNAAHAQSSLDRADAGMGQSLELLRTIRGNVTAAADGTLTDAQRAALQAEVDAALQEIDRIGANTNFNGQKLLDGGALQFQISSDLSETVSLQMPDVSAVALGGAAGNLSDLASGGTANLVNGDRQQAQAILDQAESQLLGARVETAAFEKYTLESASANLDSMQVQLASAASEIGDTDYAQATSAMVRTRILAQSLIGVVKSTLENRSLALELLKT
ncbi:MAG: flagellin [Pirellulales bacterium]|nr:flagellin [Pirellulales bacterium]